MQPRWRPHYQAWQRLAVFWHAARYGLSLEATARAFIVTRQTILNWRLDVRRGLTRLVQARSPLNRLPDLSEELARRLKREWPGWGTRRIAGILARLGLQASRTSVQRILRFGRPRRKPAAAARTAAGSLVPKRPLHRVFIDFTRVHSLFRTVRIGAIIDGFSRKILAIRSCPTPTTGVACALVREAIHRWGRPTWLISDRDVAFTAGAFTRLLRRRSIRRQFGAIGKKAAPARIERFWQTLKAEYAGGIFLYRPLRTIDRDLARYATWFNRERPHQGIGLRAPDEIFLGRKRKKPRLITRARLEVCFLHNDRRLPVLRLRSAA